MREADVTVAAGTTGWATGWSGCTCSRRRDRRDAARRRVPADHRDRAGRYAAGEVDALVAGAARSGAAGIGFEPSHAPADALVDPCRRHELPLVIFGRDVRFVDITHVVHERLVSSELATLRRAVSLQAQLREAAREGLGPAGLVAALGDVLGAQVLLERSDRTPIAASPEDGLDVAFMDALDRYRQRLPTPLHSRPVTRRPAARAGAEADELDVLAVDEAAVPALGGAGRAAAGRRGAVRRAGAAAARLAEGRAGSARRRPAGALGGRRPLARDRCGRCTPAARWRGSSSSDWTRWSTATPRWSRCAATATRGRSRAIWCGAAPARSGSTPAAASLADAEALAGAERACLVAAAAATAVRHGSELGALGCWPATCWPASGSSRGSSDRAHLVEALVATGWSKAAAARRLGIARQRLYERLAALSARHRLDFDLPQTRVELALETWAVRMAELAHG